MSARKLSIACWLEAVRLRLHDLEREDTDDIHPMGRNFYYGYIEEAKEAWRDGRIVSYPRVLSAIARAMGLAEERLVQERRYRDENAATARGLR